MSRKRGIHTRPCGLVLVGLLASCRTGPMGPEASDPLDEGPETMKLSSAAFEDGGSIPPEHTCDGEDLSPPLSWTEVPEGTRSLALVVDDPDAPRRVWTHWVVFDLPPDLGSLPADAADSLPAGAKTGTNDWGKQSYGGPCPPSGRHRYFHKLYALDTTLDLDAPTKAELERAMQGHVLGHGELVGTYQKQQ